MERYLDILIVHDDPVEAVRLVQELARQKVPCASRCVRGHDEFLQALTQHQPDLILFDSCHNSSPFNGSFSGFAALDLTQQRCPGLPFVFVSGSCDPGIIVEMYASGAAGCVYRRCLTDLGPVIKEAVQEAIDPLHLATSTVDHAPHLPLNVSLDRPVPEPRLQLCGQCRRVRDDAGNWEELELYLQHHERAVVSLSVCPACVGVHR